MAKAKKQYSYKRVTEVYYDSQGKRHQIDKKGRTKAEARAKITEAKEKIEERLQNTGSNISVAAFFEKWIRAREGKVTENTILRHTTLFGAVKEIKIERKAFGDWRLKDIRADHAHELSERLRMADKQVGQGKYSSNTINQIISLLYTMFTAAEKEDIIAKNPFRVVGTLKRTEPEARDTKHRAITRGQQKLFLDAAKERNSWYRWLYQLLLFTGLRIGEAGAITPRDIDFKNSILYVRRTLTRDVSGGICIGSSTKTKNGVRTIPLKAEAVEALREQMKLNQQVFGSMGLDEAVFRSIKGSLLVFSTIRLDMANICETIIDEETGRPMEPITAHSFRHTFATRCAEEDMKPSTLKGILGHSSYNITMDLYYHLTDEEKQKGMLNVAIM